MPGLKWMFSSLPAVLILSSCGECDRDKGLLTIDREYRAPRMVHSIRDAEFVEVMTRERTAEKLEGGLYKLVIPMTPSVAGSLTVRYSSDAQGADPFADPAPTVNAGRRVELSFQQVLQEAGVKFPEGTSAKYNSVDWTLTVVNDEDQIDLVEAFFDSLCISQETVIHVRAEIYELAIPQVVQLIESAAHESDHTPERNAAKRAVEQGKGKLVAMPSVIGRSGQRSTVEDLTEVSHLDPAIKRDEGEEEKGAKRGVSFGTVFEVDPVLGADEYSIDVLYRLEHDLVSETVLPTTESASAPILVTRPKSISSQVTLKDGSYLLVGSWKSGDDTMQVVFLTATVQYLADMRPVVKTKSLDDSGQVGN